jgi:hypothetical protein
MESGRAELVVSLALRRGGDFISAQRIAAACDDRREATRVRKFAAHQAIVYAHHRWDRDTRAELELVRLLETRRHADG